MSKFIQTHCIKPQNIPCSFTGFYKYVAPKIGKKPIELILVRTLGQSKRLFSTPIKCRWVKSRKVTPIENKT